MYLVAHICIMAENTLTCYICLNIFRLYCLFEDIQREVVYTLSTNDNNRYQIFSIFHVKYYMGDIKK